jgi:hypothetical protein
VERLPSGLPERDRETDRESNKQDLYL